MAVSVGSITIADVADGAAGLNAIIENENQTLAAGTDGAISGLSFVTGTSAFIGTRVLTYNHKYKPNIHSVHNWSKNAYT